MSPYAVPAIRKRRLGYVWHGAEQNQLLASVNERASEYANGSTYSVQCHIGPPAYDAASALLAAPPWRSSARRVNVPSNEGPRNSDNCLTPREVDPLCGANSRSFPCPRVAKPLRGARTLRA